MSVMVQINVNNVILSQLSLCARTSSYLLISRDRYRHFLMFTVL